MRFHLSSHVVHIFLTTILLINNFEIIENGALVLMQRTQLKIASTTACRGPEEVLTSMHQVSHSIFSC